MRTITSRSLPGFPPENPCKVGDIRITDLMGDFLDLQGSLAQQFLCLGNSVSGDIFQKVLTAMFAETIT
jgi:hypothetical protein